MLKFIDQTTIFFILIIMPANWMNLAHRIASENNFQSLFQEKEKTDGWMYLNVSILFLYRLGVIRLLIFFCYSGRESKAAGCWTTDEEGKTGEGAQGRKGKTWGDEARIAVAHETLGLQYISRSNKKDIMEKTDFILFILC